MTTIATDDHREAGRPWPRLMRADTVAAYLDLSTEAFARMVSAGTMPAPVDAGGEARWDRRAIDQAADALPAGAAPGADTSPLAGRAVFTPAMLAERWGVSIDTIRAAIRSGQLQAFKLGPKLYRIRRDRAEAFAAGRYAAHSRK